jgi:hypothetical protein
MVNSVEIIPNPTLPDVVRRSIGNRIESRNSLTGGEAGERSRLEKLAHELSACDLGIEVDVDAEVVDIDSRLYEGISGTDLNIATAERKEGPEVNTNSIGISSVVEEFDNGSCNTVIRNRLLGTSGAE